jgi:hypothetical protein
LGDSLRTVHAKAGDTLRTSFKAGAGSDDVEAWKFTEQHPDDVVSSERQLLDVTLHTGHSVMGINVCDKPERPLVSSPPLAYTVATGGLQNKPDGDCYGLNVQGKMSNRAGLQQSSSFQVRGLDDKEHEQAEDVASASTFPAGSNPETDSGDSMSRPSQDVVHANVQVDDGITTDATCIKAHTDGTEDATSTKAPRDGIEDVTNTNAPTDGIEDATSTKAPTDGIEDATSTKVPTDGIEADACAVADMGTIAAPVSASLEASQKQEATKILEQTQSVSTIAPTSGIEDAPSTRARADSAEAPLASPGRELCHISEWYHRVQFVEEDEGQREHPPLKTPAPAQAEKQPSQQPHKEAQESKHSPRQLQRHPRKSPSRKSGTAQRASRAEDVMLW